MEYIDTSVLGFYLVLIDRIRSWCDKVIVLGCVNILQLLRKPNRIIHFVNNMEKSGEPVTSYFPLNSVVS